MNAEILSVGTELLLGGTVNTDARDISLALAELGVNVYWHTVVGDNPARLTECLYRARNRADLIITTGGLGPTCDDLTKQTLARAFDRKLYLNEDALADIRFRFVGIVVTLLDVQRHFIRAAVFRAAQRADGARDGRMDVRARAGDDAAGEGRGVEFVFRVQDQ